MVVEVAPQAVIPQAGLVAGRVRYSLLPQLPRLPSAAVAVAVERLACTHQTQVEMVDTAVRVGAVPGEGRQLATASGLRIWAATALEAMEEA